MNNHACELSTLLVAEKSINHSILYVILCCIMLYYVILCYFVILYYDIIYYTVLNMTYQFLTLMLGWISSNSLEML